MYEHTLKRRKKSKQNWLVGNKPTSLGAIWGQLYRLLLAAGPISHFWCRNQTPKMDSLHDRNAGEVHDRFAQGKETAHSF